MPDGSSGAVDQQPFETIMPVRDVISDVQQMQDNLEDLEGQLRMLEWQLLGGRGMYDPSQCQKLCDGTERSMEFIADAIGDLPDPYEDGDSDE